jgi:Anti-sigma-K factor rskA
MSDNRDQPSGDSIEQELAALLSDPSLWAVPGDDLESRVIAAIKSESAVVVPHRQTTRSVWRGRMASGVIGAAAAAALVFVLVPNEDRGGDQRAAAGEIELVGSELAGPVSGGAEIFRTESGVAIEFAVPGLPRRDGGDFYQGWLKNCEGTLLVPVGSFHDLADATGWAGVDIADFPVLTVTRESAAAPKDVLQGSSGEIVVSGNLAPCAEV